MSSDRRTFLKGLAAASVAGAVLPARARAGSPATAAAPVWRKAPCPLCPVGCGLLVGIENGRAVAVKGDPESPVSRGLACARGYHAVQGLYGGDRIARAQVRRNGRLVPATIGEALDLVARALGDSGRQGAERIAFYGGHHAGSGAASLARLFPGASFDTEARVHGASAAAALASSFGGSGVVGSYDDLDHADVFVLWDSNLAETAPVLFSRMLERRRRDPAVRIVCLGTRATRTSFAADRALFHAPGTTLAVANGIAHEIVARRQMNRDFLREHVAFKRGERRAPIGPAQALAPERVRDGSWAAYTDFLRSYDPAEVQRASGLPVEELRWLASAYADPARRVVSVWDEAIVHQANGAATGNALYNIHLLLGRIATPGNAALAITRQAAPSAAGARSQRDAVALFAAADRGDLRVLWVHDADPVADLPTLRAQRRGRRWPNTLVVASATYPNATTALADVVLPTAMWIEHDGSLMTADQRIERIPRLVTPPGDASSADAQFLAVARRLGAAPAAMSGVPAGGGHVRHRYATGQDPQADRRRGAYDFHAHPDHKAWIWVREQEPPRERPDGAYPLWLEVGAVLEHAGTGGVTRRIPVLHRAAPRAYVEMHRQDAQRLGIRPGDRVRVTSRRGAVEAEARIDHRSQPRPGQLFVPVFDEAVPVRALMPDWRCAHSGQPELAGCAVRLERVGGRDGA